MNTASRMESTGRHVRLLRHTMLQDISTPANHQLTRSTLNPEQYKDVFFLSKPCPGVAEAAYCRVHPASGVPGRVHVSETTFKLLPQEKWEPTGGINVKGKVSIFSYGVQHKKMNLSSPFQRCLMDCFPCLVKKMFPTRHLVKYQTFVISIALCISNLYTRKCLISVSRIFGVHPVLVSFCFLPWMVVKEIL